MWEREQALDSADLRSNKFFDNLILVSIQSREILYTLPCNNLIIWTILQGGCKNADLM